jgi:hypothetical protein
MKTRSRNTEAPNNEELANVPSLNLNVRKQPVNISIEADQPASKAGTRPKRTPIVIEK